MPELSKYFVKFAMRSRSFFSIAMLGPPACAVILIIGTELALEYRAKERGFATLAFGTPDDGVVSGSKIGTDQASSSAVGYGPTPSFPFRNRIDSYAPSATRHRLWVSSASHAEDVRLPVDALFPTILEDTLNARPPVSHDKQFGMSWQVLNASRAGRTIQDNVTMLKDIGSEWSIDVALLYQMPTDLAHYSKVSSSADVRDSERPHPLPRPWATPLGYCIERSTTYELLKSNVTSWINVQCPWPDDLPGDSDAYFRARLELWCAVVEDLGAKPILCTFALRQNDGPISLEDQMFMAKFTPSLSPQGWYTIINRWNQIIRTMKDDYNVIDLARESSLRQDWFRDPVHFSVAGHQAVGTFLAKEIDHIVKSSEP